MIKNDEKNDEKKEKDNEAKRNPARRESQIKNLIVITKIPKHHHQKVTKKYNRKINTQKSLLNRCWTSW